MRTIYRAILLCLCVSYRLTSVQGAQCPYAPSGLFIASIEEGARIFTPVRMFPLSDSVHSEGHQFPTAQRLYGGEDRVLEILGEHAGLKLKATLQRYPTQPDTAWPYAEYTSPPVDFIADAPVVLLDASKSPLPGLRAVCFDSRQPVCFIVDSRGLTLAERNMQGPTTMGLDISRTQFMQALETASQSVPADGVAILVYRVLSSQ